MRCTEPALWATIPDWDAPDELIQKYIDHLSSCRYHAEVEHRSESALHLSFDAARSVTKNGQLTFSDEEEMEAVETLERLGAFRESGGDVNLLSFKVSGKEVGTLDFTNRNKRKIKIERSQPLQIFGRAGGGPELLLATYIPAAQNRSGNYLVALNDCQSLGLDVKPLRGAIVRIKISCILTSLADEQPGLLKRFRSLEWFRPELIATGVAVFLIIGSYYLFTFYTSQRENTADGNQEYTARHVDDENKARPITKDSPQPSTQPGRTINRPPQSGGGENSQEDGPPRKPSPPVSGHQARPATPVETGAPPAGSNASAPGEGELRSGRTSKGRDSLRDVHTLFVDEQEGGFRQAVREAVVKRLGELGFVIEVSREDSDARLRLKWEGENRVRFQILSGSKELLNFSATFADTTAQGVDNLALELKGQVKKKID